MVAGHMPGICLTFGLYETFKAALLRRRGAQPADARQQLRASALGAFAAGGLSSWFFVPIDVVKTRMRLSAGDRIETPPSSGPAATGTRHSPLRSSPPDPNGAIGIARDVLRREGVAGLFRGSILTVIASALTSGLYIGCYEAGKLYLGEVRESG
ncbi:hypothetical protein CDD83_3932 [Cordyceps sp. RAO-2017]|nr:hypothetical protein CDD83_3932 [Cordyceps sp. RAO-2017]